MKLRPMDTAPRDGSEFVGFVGDEQRPRIVSWFAVSDERGGWWVANCLKVSPFGWLPLPAPPRTP